MTLSNQKDEVNQTERKLSKTRLSSSNLNTNVNGSSQYSNRASNNNYNNSIDNQREISDVSDEEVQRRIEAIEEIVEGKKIGKPLKKKKIIIESNSDSKPLASSMQMNIETPKDATTTKRIIDFAYYDSSNETTHS